MQSLDQTKKALLVLVSPRDWTMDRVCLTWGAKNLVIFIFLANL